MKWLWLILAIPVVAGGAIYFLGALSPQNHVASGSLLIAAPPTQVWQLLTDYAAYPRWRASVKSTSHSGDDTGMLLWTEDYGHMRLSFVEEERQEQQRLVRRITGTGLDFGGRWIFEITGEGTGTRLTITEEGEVYSPIYRFFSRYVFGHSRNLQTFLADAKAALER